MSIVIIGTAYPLPEHRAEIISTLEDIIPRIQETDEGCQLYTLHEGRDRLVTIKSRSATSWRAA